MKSHVTPYHLLPTTEIFIAEYQGEVIFTMSLVIDGDLGVPMEHVYGDEIARFAPGAAGWAKSRAWLIAVRTWCGSSRSFCAPAA